MAYGNMWRFLLITIAVCSTQAQQDNTPDPNEIIFPGPTERPDRFPLNPQGTTLPQDQGAAENQPATTSSPDISSAATTSSADVSSTTPSAAYTQCFNSCLSTSEYNPICGTDNIVYSNPGRLSCAQRCGKDVQEGRRGACVSGQRVP